MRIITINEWKKLNEEISYPAAYNIGDEVEFNDNRTGQIVAVKFTKSKVFYDILDDYDASICKEIDSAFIK